MPPTPTTPRRRTRRRASTTPTAADGRPSPATDLPAEPPSALTAAVLAAAAGYRFGEIEVPVTIARALEQMGYVTPTEVQARTIPVAPARS